MTVTIIIPVFNRFELANRAIRSIVQQKYQDWELFVIDDCSNTAYELPDFCRYAHQPITLLRNSENLGPGLSRQRGVNLSKGEYICFLDSDDYYDPDFLFKSVEMHQQQPNIAATYTAAKYIQTGIIRAGSDCAFTNIMPTLFERLRPWPTCALVWKKKYIANWKPLRTNQDSLFELECCINNNEIAHIPEVLCHIDKDTGLNTSDLVSSKNSDIHRNHVALYAMKNRFRIVVKDTDREYLDKVIVNRLIYVSSKLAGHGLGKLIIKNSLFIFACKQRTALLLLFLAIPVLLPIKPLHKLVKSIISKLVDE